VVKPCCVSEEVRKTEVAFESGRVRISKALGREEWGGDGR
jgi:hypothetical protein